MTRNRSRPRPSGPTPPSAEQIAGGPTPVEAVDRRGQRWIVLPGHPLDLGVTETRHGLNFAVVSAHATDMTLVLFAPGEDAPLLEIGLAPDVNRTGNVWHVEVHGLDSGTRYGWRADRRVEDDVAGRSSLVVGAEAKGDQRPETRDQRPRDIHRFDPNDILIDPYARALSGGSAWGVVDERDGTRGNAPRRRSLYVSGDFDWGDARPPHIPLADKVIYELHVRGFTRHASSGVAHPGTYLGLIEKIPYLCELGVTTVELLPVYEFDELENPRSNPRTGEPLRNFWGYSPIGFFAPKAGYAVHGRDGGQVAEFKTLVRALHRAGIEVFLDVVFNHTAEGALPPGHPSLSFRGLDNATYYILDPETGAYRDFSGCGNTLNCNHPVVRNLILDALRYWVGEMHVDGFRFDLASILARDRDGEVLARPPVLERIAGDPLLAGTSLIAEAWDAAGLYQVGTFPAWGRWAEWNGPFRDQLRHFVRGDPGFAGALASRLAGSADLFQRSGRSPAHSINFVTCHDGFTLADLVSYDRKHNHTNGEDDRDGSNDNTSWNGGVEGPSDDPAVRALRARQTRNFLTLLFCSQGTPMLLAGDELGRSQQGNNNAYCQDNEVSWIDWRLLDEHRDLFRFTKLLIAFRRAHPVLRQHDFLDGPARGPFHRPDVIWHGVRLDQPDFGPHSQSLAMHLPGEHAPAADCDVYLAANAWTQPLQFELPALRPGTRWFQVIDTAAPSPRDIAEPGAEPAVGDQTRIEVQSRSCVVLISR